MTLWLLAVHERRAAAFDAAIHAAASGENEVHAGPLKGFARIMEKAAEYEEERGLTAWEERVLAPLHVVDILRATVQVGSAARAAEVEAALLESMPLVRAKMATAVRYQTTKSSAATATSSVLLMSGGAEGAIGGSRAGPRTEAAAACHYWWRCRYFYWTTWPQRRRCMLSIGSIAATLGGPAPKARHGSAAVGAASDRGEGRALACDYAAEHARRDVC